MKKFIPFLTAVATIIIGVGLLRILSKRARKPSRLLLFRVNVDNERFPHAAAAIIGPNIFQLLKPFEASPFDNWEFIASAANRSGKWLILKDAHGAFATGLIDENFRFSISKYYGLNGKFTVFPWFFAAVNGLGFLLCIGSSFTVGMSSIGFAQVLDDGTYQEWWSTEVAIPFSLGTSVIGLRDAHAWLVPDAASEQGCDIYIFDVKHAQILSHRRWEEKWDGMVNEKNILFLYGKNQRSETCLIDSNHQLITIKKTNDDKDLLNQDFDRVTSTLSGHLCWSWSLGGGPLGLSSVRTLSENGFKTTQRVSLGSQLEYWHYIVPC